MEDASTLTRELYTRYGSQIQSYCFRRLRSREEAEDAVQTTFLNAFRALQRGTAPRAEQAWLYTIAHHVCDGRRTSPLVELPETIPAPPRHEPEQLMGLKEALDAMPENQRRAILLREWRGLSYKEIADELELSQTAVEMLIFRARRSLARSLAPAAVEEALTATA